MGHAKHILPEGGRAAWVSLSPCAASLCNSCTVVTLLMAVYVHAFYEYSDTRPAVTNEEDPWMESFLYLAATMALAGLIFETSLRLSIRFMNLQEAYQEEALLRSRMVLNSKMLYVFSVLTCTYHAMAFDKQYVHEGWLADYYGGHQIVYSVRYIEWVCCAPVVLSVSGFVPDRPGGRQCNYLWPSSLLTGAYCIISWQGLVVKSVFAGWLCIGWAFVGYFVASWEQLYFAWHLAKQKTPVTTLRAYLIVYLVFMFGLYGLVYLLPIPGWLSATLENKFYCLFDMTFKFGSSILNISIYDVSTNGMMRAQAEIAAEDVEALIKTASVPIFGVDSNGMICQWNAKASELIGFPDDEVMDRPLLDIVGPRSRSEVAETMRLALADERTAFIQVTMVTRAMERGEGNLATLILSASVRRNKKGDPMGVTFIGCDLTQVEAYKDAEVRKQRFMAVVSHELRSPLHGIIGLAQHLNEDEADKHKSKQLALVGSCAARLLDLVVNIMEMAGLSQAKGDGSKKTIRLQHDEVKVSKLIEETITLVRNAEDKARRPLLKPGVRIVSRMQPMPVIIADQHRCTQVFFNIIANAAKFTQKGEITIKSSVDAQNRWVDVFVQDTGPGIPQKSLERIFLPFEQEDNSDCRHYEGIGLGLSIAQEVVRLHGGRIDVQSTVGVGTTFAVRLPMKLGQSVVRSEDALPAPEALSMISEQEEEVEMEPEPSPPPKRDKRSRPLVLLVDDDIISQTVMEGMLEEECDIRSVFNGWEAIDHLEHCGTGLPDAVILDVMMPGVTGLNVLRHIREKLGLSAQVLPVAMVTANPSKTLQAEGYAIGCNVYFMLPIDREKLLEWIDTAVNGHQGL